MTFIDWKNYMVTDWLEGLGDKLLNTSFPAKVTYHFKLLQRAQQSVYSREPTSFVWHIVKSMPDLVKTHVVSNVSQSILHYIYDKIKNDWLGG